ncbi:winged helix-turn-helix domain-containing protein [Cognaticolwellia mytili]|uniref:winged helix-turn-helix domain-containing protein n=1 Tax=Cognaticolwellia mytili TaxID=1888913 RepID=UPI001F3F10B9|nr:winged helix-turn-helix domain-containing protein [Cognaticolwellia mytili]
MLLTRNGEAFAIRHTEAKVLAVLLTQLETVLNKEDILCNVWQSKVVSEQVVFQNISNLRSLFGNDAIKTFPKRGYQWQLNTEVISPETLNQSISLQPQVQQPPRTIAVDKKRSIWQFSALITIIFLVIGIIYTQNAFKQETNSSTIKLAYIPITNLDDTSNKKHEEMTLQDNSVFDFTVLSDLNTELFANKIEIEYPKLSQNHPFILTGKIRTYQQRTYLDFMLKGPAANWEGQLTGSSKANVIEQLQQHLKLQVIYDLITTDQPPELKLAKLSIAQQVSPYDLIILRKLSITYLKVNELDKAMALADKLIKLAQSQNNSQHIGRGLLYQSKILRKKQLYDLSSDKLTLAMAQFEKINDLEHQWQTWYNQAWLAHYQNDYPAVKISLLKAAELAYSAKNKLGEIESLITLVSLAHDHKNNDDKYLYLQEVERKMAAYNFPIYHTAEVSYSYATFAKALSEKEPHLKKVLQLTMLTPEHWVAQSSRRQLVRHYITQNRLIDAQTLVDSMTADNYNNSYLKTIMAQATQQTSAMINHAQRTFEQAQLAGNPSLSLDAALLLCNQQVNCDFYSQYINDNATTDWRNVNQIKLLALNL